MEEKGSQGANIESLKLSVGRSTTCVRATAKNGGTHFTYAAGTNVRGVNDAASISTPRRERFVPMVSICLYVSDLRYVSGPKLSP